MNEANAAIISGTTMLHLHLLYVTYENRSGFIVLPNCFTISLQPKPVSKQHSCKL